MATGDLTTLANVKQWLGVQTTTDDALLTRLVTASSQYIQSWLNRTIAPQVYSEVRDGNGKANIYFKNWPVTAVSSLVMDGITVPASPDGIQPGYTFDTRMLYLIGYAPNRAQQNIVLQYTAGYASTPPELEQACIELCALRYRERDRIGHASKSVAGEVVSFTIVDLPKPVLTILNNYKRVIPTY